MASKGKKFKSYSPELKQEILDKYFSGKGTSRSLAREYNISFNTIDNWICKTKHGKNICVDHRPLSSGNRKDENIDYKERYEILKNYQAFLKAQREKK